MGAPEMDTGGVPQPVEEEETSAQTVETPTLTDSQLLAILDEMADCRSAA